MQSALLLCVVLLLSACASNEEDQVVADLPIAYIMRPVPIEPNSNPPVPVEPDVRDPIEFSAGGDVYIRDNASPSATPRNITSCITGGTGDVKDLESSYDGQKLIFSLRLEDPDPNDDVVPSWNIYEYDVTTGSCPRRVIFSDITAEEGDDLGPVYLPDGRIVFTSSRQRLTGAIQLDEGKPQFPPLEEDQRVPNLVLHVMSSSGNGIQQISFNQSHDLDPTILDTGEILFSRWDHMGGSNVVNLYKIRPDGTELKLVYGAHGHNIGTGGSSVQFLSPRELDNGLILAMMKPFTNSAGGGIPVLIDANQYSNISQPTWPYQGALSGSGQVNAVSLNVTTDGSISPAGRFRSIYPLMDGTNRAFVSWTQCRLQRNNGDIEPCIGSIPASATEAFPIYGIYVYDLGRQTQLPVVLPREGFMFDEPVVITPRSEPAILFDKAPGFGLDLTLLNENVGLLHIRSVYDFDGSFNSLGGAAADLASMADPSITDANGRPARFLRLVKGAYIPDDDVHDFLDRIAAFGRSNGRAVAIRQG
ncbi:TolB family protein, partial [Kaarinaea lacus]